MTKNDDLKENTVRPVYRWFVIISVMTSLILPFVLGWLR